MTALSAANDNRPRTPAGMSYYPEMGERAPAEALLEASLSHYGRHYYVKFWAKDEVAVLVAFKAAKVRFSGRDSYVSCVTNEERITVCMTCAAYDKLRKSALAICTSAILLD